jgi:exodeoxyribonuclease V beta subunit
MEFLYPASEGMMKGFADLVFLYDGKYYLLDWKSNFLGPSDADYTPEKMAAAMEQHDYFLQASIYAAALERYVKLFDSRPFDELFGGALYFFVRGSAVHSFIPTPYGGRG